MSTTHTSQLYSTQQPILLIHVAREINVTGYKIWLILKIEAGLEIRAEHGSRQIRLVIPRPGGQPVNDVPADSLARTHTVESIDALRIWLKELVS